MPPNLRKTSFNQPSFVVTAKRYILFINSRSIWKIPKPFLCKQKRHPSHSWDRSFMGRTPHNDLVRLLLPQKQYKIWGIRKNLQSCMPPRIKVCTVIEEDDVVCTKFQVEIRKIDGYWIPKQICCCWGIFFSQNVMGHILKQYVYSITLLL